jgi:hypothetical protein
MTYTKKCPGCGSKRSAPRPPTSWMASLPFVSTFSCQECRQQFVYVFPFSIAIENRRYPRSKLPVYFLLRVRGPQNQYTRIANISPGGIAFTHHTNTVPAGTRFLVVDLYNCNDGSSLESLTAEVVATSEQRLDIQGRKTSLFTNSARFIHLNQAQKKVLSTCISQHGSPLALSPAISIKSQ